MPSSGQTPYSQHENRPQPALDPYRQIMLACNAINAAQQNGLLAEWLDYFIGGIMDGETLTVAAYHACEEWDF